MGSPRKSLRRPAINCLRKRCLFSPEIREVALIFRRQGKDFDLGPSNIVPRGDVESVLSSGAIARYHALASEFQIVSANHAARVAELHDADVAYLAVVQQGENAADQCRAVDELRTKISNLAARLNTLYAALGPALREAEAEYNKAVSTSKMELMAARKKELTDAEAALEVAISPLIEQFYAAKLAWHRSANLVHPPIGYVLAPMPERDDRHAAVVG